MHYTLNICPYFIVKLLMAVKVLFKVKIGGGGFKDNVNKREISGLMK